MSHRKHGGRPSKMSKRTAKATTTLHTPPYKSNYKIPIDDTYRAQAGAPAPVAEASNG